MNSTQESIALRKVLLGLAHEPNCLVFQHLLVEDAEYWCNCIHHRCVQLARKIADRETELPLRNPTRWSKKGYKRRSLKRKRAIRLLRAAKLNYDFQRNNKWAVQRKEKEERQEDQSTDEEEVNDLMANLENMVVKEEDEAEKAQVVKC